MPIQLPRTHSSFTPSRYLRIGKFWFTGLRDDFGLRVKTAVEAMKEEGPNRRSQEPMGSTGALFSSENKGVYERAKRDLAQLEVRLKEAGFHAPAENPLQLLHSPST